MVGIKSSTMPRPYVLSQYLWTSLPEGTPTNWWIYLLAWTKTMEAQHFYSSLRLLFTDHTGISHYNPSFDKQRVFLTCTFRIPIIIQVIFWISLVIMTLLFSFLLVNFLYYLVTSESYFQVISSLLEIPDIPTALSLGVLIFGPLGLLSWIIYQWQLIIWTHILTISVCIINLVLGIHWIVILVILE